MLDPRACLPAKKEEGREKGREGEVQVKSQHQNTLLQLLLRGLWLKLDCGAPSRTSAKGSKLSTPPGRIGASLHDLLRESSHCPGERQGLYGAGAVLRLYDD